MSLCASSCFLLHISSQQAQEFLDKKEEACTSSAEASSTQSPKPASPASMEHRKILTPKGTINNSSVLKSVRLIKLASFWGLNLDSE